MSHYPESAGLAHLLRNSWKISLTFEFGIFVDKRCVVEDGGGSDPAVGN
jgi:hypothetical protein